MTELAYPSGLPSGQGHVRLRELRDCLQPREVLRWRDLLVDGLQFHRIGEVTLKGFSDATELFTVASPAE